MATASQVSKVLKGAGHARSAPNGRWNTTEGFKARADYRDPQTVVVTYTTGSWCHWETVKRQAAESEHMSVYAATLEEKGFTVKRVDRRPDETWGSYLEVTK